MMQTSETLSLLSCILFLALTGLPTHDVFPATGKRVWAIICRGYNGPLSHTAVSKVTDGVRTVMTRFDQTQISSFIS